MNHAGWDTYVCRTILALCLVLAFHLPGMAQDEAIQIPGDPSQLRTDLPITARAIVGIDPQVPFRKEYAWVPVRIELKNYDKRIDGDIKVQLKNGNVVYKTPVQLEPKARQVFNIYVYLPEQLDEMEFYLDTGRETIDFEVITIASPTVESTQYVAVLSSERGSHDTFGHAKEDEVDIFREVVYTSSTYLPHNWIGYQNLDVLIWDGDKSVFFSPAQEKALDRWIQMGGTLILAAGENWQTLNESPFRLYVPMAMSSSRVLAENSVLAETGGQSHATVIPSVLIATGTLVDDENIKVLLKAGGDPFLIERPWGAGKIVWVASRINNDLFNPLYQSLFEDFLTKSNAAQPNQIIDKLDDFLVNFLTWMVQAELPSTGFIAMYLGVYIIILVPINYLLFRSLGRLEWAWFTIPVWAVIFAYGAYYIGALRQQGHIVANQISIIEAHPNANTAPATTYCSIYSPIKRWYTVHFENPMAFPRIPNTSNRFNQQMATGRDSLTVSYLEDAVEIEDFLIYHWSQKTFKAQHSVDIGNGLDMDIRWDGNKIVGEITNRTGMHLKRSRLYVNGRSTELGDLEDGQSVSLDQPWDRAMNIDADNVWNRINERNRDIGRYRRNPDLLVRDDLNEFYGSLLYDDPNLQRMILFAAKVDGASLPFYLNQEPVDPEGATLFCTQYPLQRFFYGSMTIEPDSWRHTTGVALGPGQGMYGGGMNMGGYNQGGMIGLQQNSEYIGDVVTDIPLQNGRIESLKFAVDYRRFDVNHFRASQSVNPYTDMNGKPSDIKLEMHLLDTTTDQYVPLSQVSDQNGILRVPDRFVDKAFGKIKYKIRGAPNMFTSIPHEAIQVQMKIDFGSKDGDSFLGYPLELARRNN